MEKITHQFCAESLGSASVSKDGMEILLEFESEGERLWVTFPSSAIERLKTLAQDAHTIRKRPGNRGAPKFQPVRASGRDLGRFDLQKLAGARDWDRPRLHCLRNLAHEVDV